MHYGLADAVDAQRDATLETARAEHPERFGRSTPTRPKLLQRPEAAWINQPDDEVQLAA